MTTGGPQPAAGRALVTGWFSFEHGEATAGDLLAGDAARTWLADAGWEVEVATSPAFPDGPDWRALSPQSYDLLVFTCGPLAGWQVEELLERFEGVRRIAVDVSVTDREVAGRFDVVLARDHDGPATPDIALAVTPAPLPVVGVINTHAQPSYGEDRAEAAAEVVIEALGTYPAAVLDMDTRVDPRLGPLERDPRSSSELEALLRRLDVLVTSRLHGLVLGLRNGVPTVAIDVMPAGGKVTAQAAALGWTEVIGVAELTVEAIHLAVDRCRRPDARAAVALARAAWEDPLRQVRDRFVAAAGSPPRQQEPR